MKNFDKFRRPHAIYTPAISPAYCKPMSMEKNEDMASTMNWLNKDAPYHYPWSLYSAGHAFLDLAISDEREAFVQKRDRDNSFIIGDSGGFQIATGKLNFDWDNFDTVHDPANKKVTRIQLLRWLEHTSDVATTLDYPTWALSGGRNKDTQLKTAKQCLDGTVDNLRFFEDNRDFESGTRFLNVLQGRDKEESDEWYAAVKDFKFEGWALAGPARLQLGEGLPRILKLRDDKMLEGERDWLHVLGISKLSAGLVFTALQTSLRMHVNEKLQFSYDSASPFLMAAFGSSYYSYIMNNEKLSMQAVKTPKEKELLDYDGPWPWNSPVSDQFNIQDFVDPEAKHTWTLRGYLFQMYNNTYQMCEALLEAQHAYLMPSKTVREKLVPSDILELEDLFNRIFTSETPHDIINDNLHLLNNAVSRADNQFRSDFFQRQETNLFKEEQDLVSKIIDDGLDGVDETFDIFENDFEAEVNEFREEGNL